MMFFSGNVSSAAKNILSLILLISILLEKLGVPLNRTSIRIMILKIKIRSMKNTYFV
jgi:hypothetical protein